MMRKNGWTEEWVCQKLESHPEEEEKNAYNDEILVSSGYVSTCRRWYLSCYEVWWNPQQLDDALKPSFDTGGPSTTISAVIR